MKWAWLTISVPNTALVYVDHSFLIHNYDIEDIGNIFHAGIVVKTSVKIIE